MARQFSGNAFDCRTLVRIIHWRHLEFSEHKKYVSEAPFEQGVNWYRERAVSVQVGYT